MNGAPGLLKEHIHPGWLAEFAQIAQQVISVSPVSMNPQQTKHAGHKLEFRGL